MMKDEAALQATINTAIDMIKREPWSPRPRLLAIATNGTAAAVLDAITVQAQPMAKVIYVFAQQLVTAAFRLADGQILAEKAAADKLC